MSETFSVIIITGALIFPLTNAGIILASATRSLFTFNTRSLLSATVPKEHVPLKWNIVDLIDRISSIFCFLC